jgi:Family of unknown function (DUF6111)
LTIWFVRLALAAIPFTLLILRLRQNANPDGPRPFWNRLTVTLVVVWIAAVSWTIYEVVRADGEPGSAYVPAHVENGRIVPGKMTPPS